MPTYEYECKRCHWHFDVKHGVNEKPAARCPKCRAKGRRVFTSPPTLIFKGSGAKGSRPRSEDQQKSNQPPAKGNQTGASVSGVPGLEVSASFISLKPPVGSESKGPANSQPSATATPKDTPGPRPATLRRDPSAGSGATRMRQPDTHWLEKGVQLGEQFVVMGDADAYALGSWARVSAARPLPQGAFPDVVALKVLRDRYLPDRDPSAPDRYRMFVTEARILERLDGGGHAPRLLGQGYLAPLSDLTKAPTTPVEIRPCSSVDELDTKAEEACREGWRPFLVLQYLAFEDSLVAYLGRLGAFVGLPLWEALEVARQGARLLQTCHEQGIYYLDHKLEHVVFYPSTVDGPSVLILDWNVSEWHRQDNEDVRHYLPQEDLQRFACYVLYPLFSGRTTGGGPATSPYFGNVAPSQPPLLPGTGFVDFGPAGQHMDLKLQAILSRAMVRNGENPYRSVAEFCEALGRYEDKWLGTAGPIVDALKVFWQSVTDGRAAECLAMLEEEMLPDFAQHPLIGEFRRLHVFLHTMLNSS